MTSSSNGDISTRYIYILELENGNYYTGYTTDVQRRWQAHISGKNGARYTRTYKPKRIAQCWQFEGTVGQALKIERLIKRRPRAFKTRIIQVPEHLAGLVAKHVGEKITITSNEILNVAPPL
jgi:putative endonuclease